MATRDWKVKFRKVELSPTYMNVKTGEHIAIGHKQLGSFDNFTNEKFPFLRSNFMATQYVKWFSTKQEAFKYLKEYMRTH